MSAYGRKQTFDALAADTQNAKLGSGHWAFALDQLPQENEVVLGRSVALLPMFHLILGHLLA